MNNHSFEYNARQLRLMLSCIDDFEKGQFGLGTLVSNLEGLRSVLEGTHDFGTKFDSAWGKLEDTLALMLDQGRFTPNELEKEWIGEALLELRALIENHGDS